MPFSDLDRVIAVGENLPGVYALSAKRFNNPGVESSTLFACIYGTFLDRLRQ